MSEPIYRDAEPGDAADLAELGARSFTETFGHLYDPGDLALFLEKHTADCWANELTDPDRHVRVVEHNGVLIGYIKLTPPSLPFTTNRRALEIAQLYVLKPWQGAGIAARLMNWLVAKARQREAEELYLSVFTDNHRARRFYERYGFGFVQTYAFMVGNHADEDIIMRLAL